MAAMISKIRKLLANTILVMVSILIVLLLLEMVMRSLGYSKLFDVYSKPSLFWEYDPLLGWRHAPNSTGVYTGPKPFPMEFNNEIHINSDGLRGEEIPMLSQEGYRVLFLGDSVVAALEVENRETFVWLLSEKLTEAMGTEVQVINAGVRGYGTDQSYLYYTSKGHEFNPDLVVFMHSDNDPDDDLNLHRMKRPFGKSAVRFTADGKLKVLNSSVPKYELCSAIRLNYEYELIRYDTVSQRAMCKIQILLLDHSVLFSYIVTSINNNVTLVRWLDQLAKPTFEVIYGTSQTTEFKRVHTNMVIEAMNFAVLERGSGFLAVVPNDSPHLDSIVSGLADDVELFLLDVGDRKEVTWKNDGHFTQHGHQVVANRLFQPIADALLKVRQSADEMADRP